MANHKSAKKRNRSSETKRSRNRIKKNALKSVVKKLRLNTDKKSATDQLISATSMLDKLAKTNQIHKNKAANLKSKLTRLVNNIK